MVENSKRSTKHIPLVGASRTCIVRQDQRGCHTTQIWQCQIG